MAGRRVVSRGTSRKLVWARTNVTLQPLGGLHAGVDLLDTFRSQGGSSLGATVTRVRGAFSYTPGGVALVNSALMGLYVDSVGLAPTDVADPFTVTGEDWMAWNYIPVVPLGATLGTNTPDVDPVNSWELDVRSQRKVEELQQTLYFVLHNFGGAADQFSITGSVSVLLRLP